MTRIAVLSDLHGNSAATEPYWPTSIVTHPDEVICLGDLVGYGARPNEVIDVIRRRNIPYDHR
jgi:predicted phosphodiesterase